jgi:hypothetical protein
MQPDALALATEEELDRMAWPLLEVARMLRLARFALTLEGITDGEARRIAQHWTEAAQLQEAHLVQFDTVARAVNGVHRTLGPDGWIVPAMPPEQYRIQAHHVAAVAALLVGRRLLELQPGLSKLALALSDLAGKERDRIADLNLAALAGQCCSYAADAVFMAGRTEMRATMEEAESRRRSEAGRKGGARQQFTDDELVRFLAEWQSREGKRRGRIKAAAARFDVTEKAVHLRLKALREKREATD